MYIFICVNWKNKRRTTRLQKKVACLVMTEFNLTRRELRSLHPSTRHVFIIIFWGGKGGLIINIIVGKCVQKC